MISSAIRMFFRNWWRARRDDGKSIGKTFYQLVQKYDLNGKVDLNEHMLGYLRHWTLVRILDTEAKRWPLARIAAGESINLLPSAFVREVQELALRYERMLRRIDEDSYVMFSVHPTGMTLTEIHAEQRAWSEYSRSYND